MDGSDALGCYLSSQVYQKLREQLDQYSVGFPATESGIEIKILERLFTEEEATMYLNLSLFLEPPETVATRTGQDLKEVATRLEEMAIKGLIFRHRKDGEVKYGAVPFVVGTYEFQLKTLDRELAEMVEAYLQEAFLASMAENVSTLRTVPINQSIDVSWPVAPYASARQLIAQQSKIAVAECICRTQKGLLEESCDKPLEVCLMFSSHAEYYVDNGMARYISQEEAIRILERCEEAGLVNQPFNAIKASGMCNCCGDCCGVLRALKLQDRPADLVVNNYYAFAQPDLCTGCETCVERCQMDAIEINDDAVALVDLPRCIGCGLCVPTCPADAMQLKLKDEDQRRIPPENAKELMMEISEKRGTSLFPLAMINKD